jgi:phosphoribosylglycinamide formyltransferase-1
MTFRVAPLLSHTGSNLRALHDASRVPGSRFEIALVISNNSASQGLAYARQHGIPTAHLSSRTHADPADLDDAMNNALARHSIDLAVTAGYLKKIGPRTLRAQAVLDAGDQTTGPSVHYVTADYDAGPVIARKEIPVLPGDTAESLAARVLQQEHVLLPATVRRLAAEGQTVAVRD